MKGTTAGSLRYDMSGRKRKTKALNTTKKYKPAFREMPVKAVPYRREEQNDYKSAPLTPSSSNVQVDDSYKREVSKNYTVSIAYNKGGYMVVPNSDLTHIGR
tara:strand:+ start:305 stop:610 length:306 start_codon:yes stop_codon:yes gene_type:complete